MTSRSPEQLRVVSEDAIDSFVLEVHDYIVRHPSITDENEGFDCFREFIFERFDKFWSPYIKERNYN